MNLHRAFEPRGFFPPRRRRLWRLGLLVAVLASSDGPAPAQRGAESLRAASRGGGLTSLTELSNRLNQVERDWDNFTNRLKSGQEGLDLKQRETEILLHNLGDRLDDLRKELLSARAAGEVARAQLAGLMTSNFLQATTIQALRTQAPTSSTDDLVRRVGALEAGHAANARPTNALMLIWDQYPVAVAVGAVVALWRGWRNWSGVAQGRRNSRALVAAETERAREREAQAAKFKDIELALGRAAKELTTTRAELSRQTGVLAQELARAREEIDPESFRQALVSLREHEAWGAGLREQLQRLQQDLLRLENSRPGGAGRMLDHLREQVRAFSEWRDGFDRALEFQMKSLRNQIATLEVQVKALGRERSEG